MDYGLWTLDWIVLMMTMTMWIPYLWRWAWSAADADVAMMLMVDVCRCVVVHVVCLFVDFMYAIFYLRHGGGMGYGVYSDSC